MIRVPVKRARAVGARAAGPGARVLASYARGEWSVTPGDGGPGAACEISGGDSPMALFVMGCIGADHPGVTVSDHDAARAFKRYLPGL